MNDDIEWLHRFLDASVFGPPPSEIQRAHRIVDALVNRPEAVSTALGNMDCPHHYGGTVRYCAASLRDGRMGNCHACRALHDSESTTPQLQPQGDKP